MSTTNVDGCIKTPDVRFGIVGIEHDKGKPQIVAGENAEKTPEFVGKGKIVLPTKVTSHDDGTVSITFKKNGALTTLKLKDHSASELKLHRTIKENPVPASNGKTLKTKGESR